MRYKIVITPDAEQDLDGFVKYLLFEKKSKKAAKNILDEFLAYHKINICIKKVNAGMVIQAAFFYNVHASESYILPDYSQIVCEMQAQIGLHC